MSVVLHKSKRSIPGIKKYYQNQKVMPLRHYAIKLYEPGRVGRCRFLAPCSLCAAACDR